jgi:hypothetical protein
MARDFFQVAGYTGVSPRTIHRWLAYGRLPHCKASERIILSRRQDIDRAIERMSKEYEDGESFHCWGRILRFAVSVDLLPSNEFPNDIRWPVLIDLNHNPVIVLMEEPKANLPIAFRSLIPDIIPPQQFM